MDAPKKAMNMKNNMGIPASKKKHQVDINGSLHIENGSECGVREVVHPTSLNNKGMEAFKGEKLNNPVEQL